MKRLFTIFSVVFLGIMAVSCYDDTALRETIADHESRILSLETQCQEMNSNIQALKTLAESNGNQIKSVDPIKEGDKEIGYVITFTDGTSIKVYHGKDGADGADGKDGKDGESQVPQIGAAAEEGVLYWTLDGEWILDGEGNKIPVTGEDATAPQLKVEDGMWYVSYDEGQTWTVVASAMTDGSVDSLFESITFDEDYVYFTLASGEALAVPRVKEFDIVFSNDDVSFFPGEESLVEYTLVGADEYAQVKAFGPDGWTVTVEANEADPSKGYIKVVSPLEFVEGDVTVIVSDGRYKTFIRTLVFKPGELISSNYTFDVDADVTSVDIKFSTNFDYWVATDADWITIPETKSEMRDETITVTLTENETYEPRKGFVYIVSKNNYIIRTFSIYQFGRVYDAWYIVGAFNNWTCGDENYKMTREDDMFVFKGFKTTGTSLKFNIGEWGVERTARFMSADYGALLNHYGDDMEVPEGAYDIYMDKNASIVYFMTEGKTPEDKLEEYVLEEGQYWIVAGGAWSGFGQVVAAPLAEDVSYGYLPYETPGDNAWGGLSSTMKNAYTFTKLEDGGFTIQDSYGRYLYQVGNYNSYNVSYDLPSEGYIWDVTQTNDWGYTDIVNREKGKTVMFDTNYGSFGCYPEFAENRYLPYLVKAENPIEVEEKEDSLVWYLVGDFNAWTSGDADYRMTDEGDVYAFYGFTTEGAELKFNVGDWTNNRGGTYVADSYFSVTQDGVNIVVPAGTYNIYLTKETDEAYFEPVGASEVVLWEGELIADDWKDQPYALSDAGLELAAAGAQAGQIVYFYIDPIESAWQLQIVEGHWGPTYISYSSVGNSDGSFIECDLAANGGKVGLTLTQEILDAAFTQQWWGGTFILNGDNVKVTKITLSEGEGTESDDNAAGEAAFTNLVTNGGFEDGTTGWTGLWGKYTYSLDNGFGSDNSLSFTLTADCSNQWDAQLFWVLDNALEAGVTYAYEFYAKSNAALDVQFIGQNESYAGIYKDTFTTTEDWTLYTGEFTYAEGDTENIIRVGVQFGRADSEGAQFWIDDFKFGPKG